jgi:hypothetical protein
MTNKFAARPVDAKLNQGPPFTNTRGVIEALGGIGEVAKLTGSKHPAVGNWQTYNRFPGRFYTLMLDALHERGFHAPARLWGIAEPSARKSASPRGAG